MNRVQVRFTVANVAYFKTNLLLWAELFETHIWLDSNNHREKYSQYESVFACGIQSSITSNPKNAFQKLKNYQEKINDFHFGYFGYDLKNDIEDLQSDNHDGLKFPDLFFFQPKKIIFISNNSIVFSYLPEYENEINIDYKNISATEKTTEAITNKNEIEVKERISKTNYIGKVNKLLEHIHRGDLYEANFCQEFYIENIKLDCLKIYNSLNDISKPPFACFFKHETINLLSASPERYLKKIGNKVISQPIKGTAKRSNSKTEDFSLKQNLKNDLKEKAENIMIVDLVRNDLSRLAIKGSVKVEELCKVYSFKQVHQMISTISSVVAPSFHPVDIIKNSYPMGSMTGAPKVAAMETIEKLEETKRGLYSGAVGYFTPNGDFDFNVIIRSILYNAKNKYASFSVGSAITSLSDPEKEHEECLLKAKAMKEVLK